MDQVYMYTRVCIGCDCAYRVYMYVRVFIVNMHGSSLYVYASMYRCDCAYRVYMYVRVFIGVYAWIKFICIREYV